MRSFAFTLLCFAGCTLVTDAGDRQVDSRIGRDLNYTFKEMNPHASAPLDVVVAEAIPNPPAEGRKLVLRAHARIVLPAVKSGLPYPDQKLQLRNVLTGLPPSLLFYVDSDDNDEIAAGAASAVPNAEHIWIEPVAPSGIGEFTHRFNFKEYKREDYRLLTGNVVLALDANAPDWRPPACADGTDHTLEVVVTIGEQQIGYYRNFSSNPLPTQPIRLDDIVDAGSTYVFEISIDGAVVRTFAKVASMTSGDFVIEQSEWYPLASEAVATVCP